MDFSSTVNIQGTPSIGQAAIRSDPAGGTFSNLTISPTAAGDINTGVNPSLTAFFGFTTLIFNLDGANLDGGSPNQGDVSFTIDYLDATGDPQTGHTPNSPFPIGSNGQNFFTITAGVAEIITSVSLTSTLPLDRALQFRVNGVLLDDPDGGPPGPPDDLPPDPPEAVPEPTSLAIWAIFALGIGGGMRWQRRKTLGTV